MRHYFTKREFISNIKLTMPGLFIKDQFDTITKIQIWNILIMFYKRKNLIPINIDWSYPKEKLIIN